MRRLIPLILLTIFLLTTNQVGATVIPDLTLNNPDEDGYINKNGAVYTRNSASNEPWCADAAVSDRGYVQWPTAAIPDNATILSIILDVSITQFNGAAIWEFTPITGKPSTAADAALWTDIGDGAPYYQESIAPVITARTFYLGNVSTDAACVDLQALLASDWFAVGIHTNSAAHWSRFNAEESGVPPTLTVRYTYMGVIYTFTGTVEDDTDANVTATVLDSDGVASTFTIPAGESVTLGFTERPLYITWNVSASYYRRIYVDADTGSFTLSIPESTFAVFTPYVRDFTNIVSAGGSYFETHRTIGGVDVLIEKVPLISLVNGIPATLTVNRVYTLVVNTNSTDYSFSFYSTTASPSPVLILDTVQFDEVMQFNTRYIHVEATRPTATSILFEYLDDLGGTLNVTMTFMTRSGTVAHTHTINATDSFTYTWNAATNTTEYTAMAEIIQSDFGNLTYSRSFLGTTTYSAPPSLAGLGTFGGASMTQAMGAIIVLAVAGLFSAKNAAAGLVVCALVTAILSYMGWLSVSTGLIVFVIFIGVSYEMGRARH